jgi:hypothetical protein
MFAWKREFCEYLKGGFVTGLQKTYNLLRGLIFRPEDGSSSFLPNVDAHQLKYTESPPKDRSAPISCYEDL